MTEAKFTWDWTLFYFLKNKKKCYYDKKPTNRIPLLRICLFYFLKNRSDILACSFFSNRSMTLFSPTDRHFQISTPFLSARMSLRIFKNYYHYPHCLRFRLTPYLFTEDENWIFRRRWKKMSFSHGFLGWMELRNFYNHKNTNKMRKTIFLDSFLMNILYDTFPFLRNNGIWK